MARGARRSPRLGRLLAAAAALAAAAFLLTPAQQRPAALPPAAAAAPQATTPTAPQADGSGARSTAAAAPAAADRIDAAFAAFFAAIARGDARRQAAALRGLLRTDEAAFAQALALLLDEEAAAADRQALALVLGTLPKDGVDDALLAALERFGGDEATALALVAALGALRDPPDEDDVFDLEAAPHFGVRGPGGIGITVRNVIADPRVERALGDLLLDRGRAAVRLAAASALQWSLEQEFSRTRFRTALQGELDDAVAATLGEALGLWTRRKQGPEPEQVLGEVLLAAERPGLAELRLRLETALEQTSWSDASQQRLLDLSHPAQPFELRAFALSTLAHAAAGPGQARAALIGAVADADAAIRRHAARLVAALPSGPDSIAALGRAFSQRDDWALRLSALTALAAHLQGAERDRLLDSASQDSDRRIAERAQRLAAPR
jgi:hypothetical protein